MQQLQGSVKKKKPRNVKKIKFRIGLGLVLFSVFMLLVFMTSLIPFLKDFFYGVFGLSSYILFLAMLSVGFALIYNRRYVLTKRYIVYLAFALLSLLCLLQMIIVRNFNGTFFAFLGYNYTFGLTPGGIITALFIAPIRYTLQNAGVYVFYGIALVIFTALVVNYLYYADRKVKKVAEQKTAQPTLQTIEESISKKNEPILPMIEENVPKKKESKMKAKEEVPLTVNAKIQADTAEEKAKQRLGLAKTKTGVVQSSGKTEETEKEPQTVREYLLSTPKITELDIYKKTKEEIKQTFDEMREINYFGGITSRTVKPVDYAAHEMRNRDIAPQKGPIAKEDWLARIRQDASPASLNGKWEEIYYDSDEEEIEIIEEIPPIRGRLDNFAKESNMPEEKLYPSRRNRQSDLIAIEPDSVSDLNPSVPVSDFADDVLRSLKEGEKVTAKPISPLSPQLPQRERLTVPVSLSERKEEKPHGSRPYKRPPLELMKTIEKKEFITEEDIQRKVAGLENTLETFNVTAKVTRVITGPSVTRYELEMAVGVPIKKIQAHQADIEYALAANGGVRIEAPIPGRSAVGIEVPNDVISLVSLKEILASEEFRNTKSPLTFALGKDITGKIKLCNLEKMPHLLVAGTTGSGKSVCLNTMILSMIYRASPDELKLILVDPKHVEFAVFSGLPHLMMPSAITEPEKAVNALSWAINEMERRFLLLKDLRVRNLEEYSQHPSVLSGENEKIPFLVIIIDEFADLVVVAKKDLDEKVQRLAQKARAVGIHLVLATQRPSVNVVTGTIKANFPSRIAFAVQSIVDSRTMLDQAGAEKLMGRGDMLYSWCGSSELQRIQGCYISSAETEAIVEYVKEHNDCFFDNTIAKAITAPAKTGIDLVDGKDYGSEHDELLPACLKYCIENGQASVTMLQRKFSLGFPRAGRIIFQMAELGYISKGDGNKPRSVFTTMDEWYELFGEGGE